ncbi:MAG: hypothetical protein L3K17_04200 [Thermoplasmata archaeon]|nr:hypothetical protein [Thermoplasmata archaeon]
MVVCPFCGAPETERLDLDGRRFLVFRCMFSPQVDPTWNDTVLAQHLAQDYGSDGGAYFHRNCDRLHLYVTKGAAARELGAPAEPAPES